MPVTPIWNYIHPVQCISSLQIDTNKGLKCPMSLKNWTEFHVCSPLHLNMCATVGFTVIFKQDLVFQSSY